jgi:hypothetical protein
MEINAFSIDWFDRFDRRTESKTNTKKKKNQRIPNRSNTKDSHTYLSHSHRPRPLPREPNPIQPPTHATRFRAPVPTRPPHPSTRPTHIPMGTLPCPAISRQSDSQKRQKAIYAGSRLGITQEVLAVLACDMPCSADLDPVLLASRGLPAKRVLGCRLL